MASGWFTDRFDSRRLLAVYYALRGVSLLFLPLLLAPSVHPPMLLFIKVPEPRTVKNRMHLDLSPVDRSRDEEVERLLALGATRAEVGQTGEESWVVLADPEGNEFCVLRSLAQGHFTL